MAEKKSKVKAHRGFVHVRPKRRRPVGDPAPKRPIGRPQRPQTPRLPRRPVPRIDNQQLQKMSDAQLRRYFNAQRRRSIAQQLSSQSRKRFLDISELPGNEEFKEQMFKNMEKQARYF